MPPPSRPGPASDAMRANAGDSRPAALGEGSQGVGAANE
jgi:hypothetical protein